MKDKEKTKDLDYEFKEKSIKKEDWRDEPEREKRSKDKKEEKAAQREERSYRVSSNLINQHYICELLNKYYFYSLIAL